MVGIIKCQLNENRIMKIEYYRSASTVMKGIFERIGKLIPGFGGYATKEKARESDYQIRLYVKRKLEEYIFNIEVALIEAIIQPYGIGDDFRCEMMALVGIYLPILSTSAI